MIKSIYLILQIQIIQNIIMKNLNNFIKKLYLFIFFIQSDGFYLNAYLNLITEKKLIFLI
jgi:hypothetical protein